MTADVNAELCFIYQKSGNGIGMVTLNGGIYDDPHVQQYSEVNSCVFINVQIVVHTCAFETNFPKIPYEELDHIQTLLQGFFASGRYRHKLERCGYSNFFVSCITCTGLCMLLELKLVP